MKTKLIIGFIIVVIIIGILLIFNLIPFAKPQPTPQKQSQTNQPTPGNFYKKEKATFSYTQAGFVPKNATVKLGQVVTWTNDTKEDMSLNSANHPTHVKFPILNVGTIPPEATGQVTFDKAGTYSFHDHYKPQNTGTITVE